MKKLFFICITLVVFGFSQSYARSVEAISTDAERIVEKVTDGDKSWYQVITTESSTATYEIVKVSSAAIILEGTVKKDGSKFWHTISWALTRMLPATARGICLATIKKPKLCNAIYEASLALVEIKAGYYRNGNEEDVAWRADKGTSNCSVTIKTHAFQEAADAATVFEEYPKKNCMPYRTPQIKAYNATIQTQTFQDASDAPTIYEEYQKGYDATIQTHTFQDAKDAATIYEEYQNRGK